MNPDARGWLAMVGGSAAAIAAVICLTSPTAVAEPIPPPKPAPVTVTQTVTAAPAPGAALAAPQAVSAPAAGTPVGS
ncbi:MAG: hypothetical protein WCE29_30910, partial [Mycobacterium sp.]